MAKMQSGSKLAAAGQNVSVEMNEDVIASIATALVVTITSRNRTILEFMDVEELKSNMEYALGVVLEANSGAKPSIDAVPTFFDDLVMTLNTTFRGIRLEVSCVDSYERPDSYDVFVTLMQSVGVDMARVRRVNTYGSSNVMQFGIREIDGVPTLVGISDSVSVEELVVRAMLTASEEEQDKLDRIFGHMDHMYVSVDELTRNWACSIPVEKVNRAG